ncbi:uncharacterized protein BDCG_05124 [Blastomyces dermatitidis ER-3]|uniref:Squalene/phytoene synthase n=3 Tax=Blastomyces TaxID=229219 RepID=A0A179UY11_BLAGS|nr:uncharacterized protein BDBG_08247 [Blastomyces gilchristii SLH14081]XP_045276822.1 uncharacterized protein BDCG_05124 [Blastomyces dermatitidis ER-3]EGE85805.2 phytoene/squalene synthetase [Blastomyces dermatitidis ATCC 18188]EQL37725.1 hypothetical protein BDFG_00774 [Blastomyces dermatitidis ATCC 26199]EEQ90004.2 hypothetical protein BDCG_05124 [Blastomyces dermatitidis ER-3]OAT12974.1 hypothetical protein BDBG_08247 [Blastomyces gilchristii SLH14081]
MSPKQPVACLRCVSRRLKIHPTHSPSKNLYQTGRPFSSSATRPSSNPGTQARAEFESSHKYCLDLLRKYDRPSYTLSTFLPRHTLSFYLALRALNISLSMIPDTTSTPTIGLMRLQFWRDTITKTLAGKPPKEPIAILLASALSDLDARTGGQARISKGWFMRMINSREQYLTNTPYTSLSALESYAENTYSTLLYLTLSALPLTSVTADHLASHIGKAAGISTVLRGIPLIAFPPPPNHHSNQAGVAGGSGPRTGAITLPLDIMAETGLKEEDVFRHGAEAPGLRDAVFTVATRASDHLITARQMLKNLRAGQDVGHDFEHEGEEGHEYHNHSNGSGGSDVSASNVQLEEVERAFGVLMPAVSTSLWLDRLQAVDFDIFKPELRTSDWRLPWKAYWANRRRTF